MKLASVFIHIVTFNSAKYIQKCLSALQVLDGYKLGENLRILITDNASSDGTDLILKEISQLGIEIEINRDNLGFSAGHNQGLKKFIDGPEEFYLCLNSDLILSPPSLSRMISSISKDAEVGSVCPKLLRADESLSPLSPAQVDAAGMYITPALRHFDRGSGELDGDEYSRSGFVFGGSGACLLMRRKFILDLEMKGLAREGDIDQIYPQLNRDRSRRLLLFDEAFFAYREDADLAWRAQLKGWRCRYVAEAIGYHVRVVTPEVRSKLSKQINLFGVRNRYLLQLNNFGMSYGLSTFLCGYIWRNLLVLIACLLREQSSLAAYSHIVVLLRRGIERRRKIRKEQRISPRKVARWFRFSPSVEFDGN